MKRVKDINKDSLKAFKKASRELEIEMHGKPICHMKIQKSKKIYDRNKNKSIDI
ncbi:MAG: hypothetical protein RSE41_00255 [Clostridia bacterium]